MTDTYTLSLGYVLSDDNKKKQNRKSDGNS